MNYINGVDPRIPPSVLSENNESHLGIIVKTSNNMDGDIELNES